MSSSPARSCCWRTAASRRARPRTTRSWPRRSPSSPTLYVNDAFGTAHRAHATTEGVAHHLPGYAGLLLEQEVAQLTAVRDDPKRPLIVVLGGAKVTDKLGVIDRFLGFAEEILIGGAMCFSFFKAEGRDTGNSLVEDEGVEAAKRVLAEAERSDTILELPEDLVLGKELDAGTETRELNGVDVPEGWMGLDVGTNTTANFAQADRAGRDRLLERADGRVRGRRPSTPAPAPSPRRSRRPPATPWSAAATRSPRCTSSASPTPSTGSRPAAAPRWS